MMLYDEEKKLFYLKNKMCFDPERKTWIMSDSSLNNLIKLSNIEAILKIQKSIHKLKVPIGVIGTNKPTPQQYETAEILGECLGKAGLYVLCGGRAGVMEAVCKGVDSASGISIGLLPEVNCEQSNKYVSIPIATGIGLARGSLIASASFCLIAIGGGNGTLAEVASGLQYNKKVFAIYSSYKLQDIIHCDTVDELVKNVLCLIFNLNSEYINEV